MASQGPSSQVHVALIPSAGMGHVTPFCRLAVALSELCRVTLVSVLPTVSSAESLHFSNFFSSYPNIRPLHFQLSSLDSSPHSIKADPFFLRWELIGKSAPDLFNHLLQNSLQPISALVIDISIASSIIPLAKSLKIPCYILFTSSASMLSFFSYFPTYFDSNRTCIADVEIPGLRTVPVASVPRPLHDSKHVFTKLLIQNGRDMLKSDGIFVNTCRFFEPGSLTWLNGSDYPPVIAIGPLKLSKMQLESNRIYVKNPTLFTWLDQQPDKSVLYVNFGSRTAMSKEQITELGLGLESSGVRFLWVIKTTIVDKDDEIEKLEEYLGEGFLDRVKDRGTVIKTWIEQEAVLRHKAIGGFLSHCGWNSVTEAVINGVRVLAWPRIGDQRVNAEVVMRSGLGVWEKDWRWEGEEGVVTADDISEKVKEMMNNDSLIKSAKKVGKEAIMAITMGGSSFEHLSEFVKKLKCSTNIMN